MPRDLATGRGPVGMRTPFRFATTACAMDGLPSRLLTPRWPRSAAALTAALDDDLSACALWSLGALSHQALDMGCDESALSLHMEGSCGPRRVLCRPAAPFE